MSQAGEQGPDARVYISHASQDDTLAEQLVRRLERSTLGFEVASTGGFGHGERSDPSFAGLPKAAQAHVVIAIVSDAYLAGRELRAPDWARVEERGPTMAIVLGDVEPPRYDDQPGPEIIAPTVLTDDAEWALFEQHLRDAARPNFDRPKRIGILCAWLDRSFVETEIAPTIAVHGLEPVVMSSARSNAFRPETAFVVMSHMAARSKWLEAALRALSADQRVVAILKDENLHPSLAGRLFVDFRSTSPTARAKLLAFLPIAGEFVANERRLTGTHWSHTAFSEQLAHALGERQRVRCARLVGAAATLLRRQAISYPLETLRGNLAALRGARYFDLLVMLADAAVSTGINDATVVRQRAQGLIETGRLDLADATLTALTARLPTTSPEYVEAMGLLGRVNKQRYVDEARTARAGSLATQRWLDASIARYKSIYEANPTRNLWHGINAVSLLARAERDGLDVQFTKAMPSRLRPSDFAQEILRSVDLASAEGRMTHWDAATAAEAAVISGDLQAAERWLTQYINDENIDAFSLASTDRQFREVLGLGEDSTLVRMLAGALEKAVAGDALLTPSGNTAPQHAASTQSTASFLVRTSDPRWLGADVPGLRVLARLGDVFACQGTEQTLRDVARDDRVLSIQRSEAASVGDVLECNDTVPLVRAAAVHHVPVAETGDMAIVAIIDAGIDVRHRAFRDSNGRTRILSVWDQTAQAGTRPAGFDFGAEYDSDAINRIIASADPNGGGPEGRWGLPIGALHGTHVTSIAAGSPTGPNFGGGVAPGAGIVVVVAQLDASLGYSSSHMLALKYIDEVARRHGRPVVVNVSLGQNGGAHDGRSPFERSFEAFSGFGGNPGRVVVKSAGNEGDTHGHARVNIVPGFTEILEWTVAAECVSPQQLELWFNSGDKLEFRLGFGPDLSALVDSRACSELQGTLANGTGFKLLYTPRHRDNGDSQLVVQLWPESAPAVAAGVWRLEIEAKATRPNGGKIEGWIERQSSTPGVPRHMEFRNHIHDEMTLSIPGTAHNVITVGACGRRMGAQLPRFLSCGPTRDQRQKPEVSAPGVGIVAARSGTSEGVVALDGTSQAAPHVTGAIALLMSRLAKRGAPQANAAQIAQALTQTTQGGASTFHPALGYGLLDVEALLNAF